MQVGINTFSFSYLKFNIEFAGQKTLKHRKTFSNRFLQNNSVAPTLTFIFTFKSATDP